MKNQELNQRELWAFRKRLLAEEKSKGTVSSYMHSAELFARYMADRPLSKQECVAFKEYLLGQGYRGSSINAILTAVNLLLRQIHREDCCVKKLRIQFQPFVSEMRQLSREDYSRLLQTAQAMKDQQMVLLLKTLGNTGIRISELSYITCQAVKEGQARVFDKGKIRVIILTQSLRECLQAYAQERQIVEGPVFVTRSGRPLHRSNIWRRLQKLSVMAQVDPNKVFPHNFRHLFAKEYYRIDRDLVKLANVLGHSSIETTRLYIQASQEEHQQSLERMNLL